MHLSADDWSGGRLALIASIITVLLLIISTPSLGGWPAAVRRYCGVVGGRELSLPIVLPPTVLEKLQIVLMGPRKDGRPAHRSAGAGAVALHLPGLVVAWMPWCLRYRGAGAFLIMGSYSRSARLSFLADLLLRGAAAGDFARPMRRMPGFAHTVNLGSVWC